jgi:hypothetical protein
MGSFWTKTYNYTNFKAAGCVFMSNSHILAAYQTKKNLSNQKYSHISGLGGKREGNESYMETALRETLEELFDLEKVPEDLLTSIEETLIPTRILLEGSYVCVVYGLDQLVEILYLCNQSLRYPILYPAGVPLSVEDLILKRTVIPESEVSHLCLLPLISSLKIDRFFLDDVKILLK